MKNFTDVVLFVYNNTEKYLPYNDDVYGNTVQFLHGYRPTSAADHLHQYLRLDRTEWLAVNQPHAACRGGGSVTPLEHCIDAFIEAQVGCSSAIQMSPRTKPLCITEEEYNKWAEHVEAMTMALSEQDIYNMTGCLPSCRLTQYTLTLEGDAKPLPNKVSFPAQRSLTFQLFFATARYQYKEQYYTYGQDSFIADVGGYLGLLLGHSLYSIFCNMEDASRKLLKAVKSCTN